MLSMGAQNSVQLFPNFFGTCLQSLSSPAALSDDTLPRWLPGGSSVSRLPMVFVFLGLLIPRQAELLWN